MAAPSRAGAPRARAAAAARCSAMSRSWPACRPRPFRACTTIPARCRPTQQRVRDAARALNWIPNAAGRALASTRTHITGAIIPTLDDQVFASQVAGRRSWPSTASRCSSAARTTIPRRRWNRCARCCRAAWKPCRSSAKHIRRNCSNCLRCTVCRTSSPMRIATTARTAASASTTARRSRSSPLTCSTSATAISRSSCSRPPTTTACRRLRGIHDTLAARARGAPRPSARRRGHDRIRAGEPARDRRQRRGHAADGRDLRQRRARAGRVARGAGARHRRARAIVDHRLRRHRARARDPAAADDDVGRHPRDRAPGRAGVARRARERCNGAGSCGAAGVAHAGFGCGAGAGSGRT